LKIEQFSSNTLSTLFNCNIHVSPLSELASAFIDNNYSIFTFQKGQKTILFSGIFYYIFSHKSVEGSSIKSLLLYNIWFFVSYMHHASIYLSQFSFGASISLSSVSSSSSSSTMFSSSSSSSFVISPALSVTNSAPCKRSTKSSNSSLCIKSIGLSL